MPIWTLTKLKTKIINFKNHAMKKNLRHLLLSVAAVMAFSACQEAERNTEELIDPWLRERTPVNVRLESQIGPAIISSDWKTDEVGTVTVSLVTATLDMSAVKVVALDFAYPESEFCPTASIKPGDTVDLSDGTAEFVVTAKTGETRTYTIQYTVFTDALEGCYSFTPVGGILDTSHSYKSGCVMIGGFEGGIVYCQVMDKYWQWTGAYNPVDEDDNVLSFRLERADDQTGQTFGTIVNTPGNDGKYADYRFRNGTQDVNAEYRLIPAGKSRWAKLGDGYITIYDYKDSEYTTPLYKLELLESGEHVYWAVEDVEDSGKKVNVPSLALHRSFGEGPFTNLGGVPEDQKWNYDERWYVWNIRNVFWLIQKDGDSPLADHDEYLAE